MFKSKGLMHTRCLMTFYDNFLQRKMENWNKTNYKYFIGKDFYPHWVGYLIGWLTPSNVLPLFDITEHKAIVCVQKKLIQMFCSVYSRVGKTGSLGPWSRVIVYCSELSFCQNDSPIGGSFWQKDSLLL